MTKWMEYLKAAVHSEASDVFFVAGKPVCEKQEGHIHPVSDVRLLPADTEQIITEMYAAAERSMEHFLRWRDWPGSVSIPIASEALWRQLSAWCPLISRTGNSGIFRRK